MLKQKLFEMMTYFIFDLNVIVYSSVRSYSVNYYTRLPKSILYQTVEKTTPKLIHSSINRNGNKLLCASIFSPEKWPENLEINFVWSKQF